MDCAQVMVELEALGTAQNRKVYQRHGARPPLFGVSFAHINKLKKKLKVNHPLAVALWQTGNSDARNLALMIADPERFSQAEAESWLADTHYRVLLGYLAGLVARTPYALASLETWMASEHENVQSFGYRVLNSLLKDGPERVSDAACRRYLKTIEETIHDSPNLTRQAMNMALIAMGSFKPQLATAAIASAGRVGQVEVDHGETGCKTPSAAEKIRKSIARRAGGPARARDRNRR